MKILNLITAPIKGFKIPEVISLLIFLALLWPIAARLVEDGDATAGYINRSIWLMILLSIICFLTLAALCAWLFQNVWTELGLPSINGLVVHFKSMELWQQLGFAWASFALLLLAAVGCLMAIC